MVTIVTAVRSVHIYARHGEAYMVGCIVGYGNIRICTCAPEFASIFTMYIYACHCIAESEQIQLAKIIAILA